MEIRERSIAMKNKMQVMMQANCDDRQAHNEEIEIKREMPIGLQKTKIKKRKSK